ncbi:MAG: PD-(D/E)XK nuclease family protein [bacterium]|nr:PD-(D/E)XK nuclease family protein [bacterium]
MGSLRFILGRAGSGKTHTCREEIVRQLRQAPDGPPLLLLVPEQATFQAEGELAAAGGGFLRAQVLGFRRLALRVLEEEGGAARPRLTEVGRLMALRALLHRHQGELRLFARAARRRGFVEQAARTLAELRAQDLGVAAIQAAGRRLQGAGGPPGLLAKLKDLELLVRAYDDYLAGRFLDPDDTLGLAACRLGQAAVAAGAEVWVDGFAGFTPQEYRVLEAMAVAARRMNITLCLDPDELEQDPDPTDLFFPTRDTYRRLRSRALATGLTLDPPLLLAGKPPRFAGAPELAFLEAHFGRAGSRGGRPKDICLVEATDPRVEVEMAAREITRLVRDNGYRWREMVVLFREVEPYRDLLGALDRCEVPWFLDERRSGLHHPLVEVVRSALEALVSGWPQQAVFRYLKTDLAPVERDEADRLENHALAHGIRGAAWTRPWPQELEGARRRAMAPLEELAQRMGRRPAPAGEWAAALREFLDRLGAGLRLEEWRQEALTTGRPEEAQEHDRVWAEVTDLLEEMGSALGEEELEARAVADVVETGLSTLRLGLVPPALDQVLVGQVDRSRLPEARAAFVLGVAEGFFPRPPQEDALFDDGERELLLAHGLELAATSRVRLLGEGYLGYIAFTRASERLWVSYPRGTEDGKAVFHSTLVRRLGELFPGLEPAEEDPLDYLASEETALAQLSRELGRAREGAPMAPVWRCFLEWFKRRPGGPEKLRLALAGLDHTNRVAPLPPELVLRLYGEPLRASVSRLERFAACPYAHFLSYGLGLQERLRFRLESRDVGTLLHDALKLLVEEMDDQGLDWSAEHERARERLADQVLEQLVPGVGRAVLMSSSRYRFLGGVLARSFRQAVAVLGRHARRSGFRPLAAEVAFGPGQDLPPLRQELEGGRSLELRGRIDRVDAAEREGVTYLRVIDYKSSRRRLDPGAVAAGLDLQLLCYLAVVLEHEWPGRKRVRAAGAFYLPLLAQPVRAGGPLSPEEADRRRLDRFRLDGLAVADPEVIRLLDRGEGDSPAGHLVRARLRVDGAPAAGSGAVGPKDLVGVLRAVRARLAGLGNRLAGGDVSIRPYRGGKERACRYCEFRAACGFDPLVGDVYREAGTALTWQDLAEEARA